MTKYEVAALRYAEKWYAEKDHEGDSMSPEKRRAWIAALEYARSMGIDDTATRVDFAVFCDGRTDLDSAWAEWR